jgi:hypothetical protein
MVEGSIIMVTCQAPVLISHSNGVVHGTKES